VLFWRVALWCLVFLLFGTSGTVLPINDIYIFCLPKKKKLQSGEIPKAAA